MKPEGKAGPGEQGRVIILRNGVYCAGWYEVYGGILRIRAGKLRGEVALRPEGPRVRDLARQLLHIIVAQAGVGPVVAPAAIAGPTSAADPVPAARPRC